MRDAWRHKKKNYEYVSRRKRRRVVTVRSYELRHQFACRMQNDLTQKKPANPTRHLNEG